MFTPEDCLKLIGPNPWILLVIGTILGWVFNRGITALMKPNIKIQLGDDAYLLKGTAKEVKFLHVRVSNLKRMALLRFLIGNATASQARAWVSFIDPLTMSEIFTIYGRWTSTREPIDYGNNKVDLGLALVVSRENIPAGESSEISVAMKSSGETEAFAFNNESYLHGWKKPDFILDEKRYIIAIKVMSGGYEWTEKFSLLNLDSKTSRFKLQS